MASEWAKGRAVEIVGPPERFAEPGRSLVLGSLAAALDEARAEGEKRGAERERWECHRIADSWAARFEARGQDEGDVAAGKVAVSIAARGPMRGPGEEK